MVEVMSDWGEWRRQRIGRYQAGRAVCGCANEAVPGTSKIEGDLFGFLNFVIGNGRQGHAIDGLRSLTVDMAFECDPEGVLVVEYDGAYWHTGREATDWAKVDRIRSLGRHHVIRVREDPLPRLFPEDVCVPKGTDAATCARLVLIHLLHDGILGRELFTRIEQFLLAAAHPLEAEGIHCEICSKIAGELSWYANRSMRPRHLSRAVRRASTALTPAG